MKKTKDRIVSIIALLVTVLYPCLFMYFQNVDEGNFKEILPAVGKFLLVTGIVFILVLAIIKRFSKAALYTILSMIAFMNFLKCVQFIFWLFWGVFLRYFYIFL